MASLLYTSNASVGVRYPGLQIVDTAGAVRAEVDAPSGQNPSVAVVYTWAPNIGSALGLKSNPQSMPWPDVYLPSGWSIQAYALSALAGDTIGPLSLTLQQAPTGPGVTALPLLPTPLLV